VYRGGQELRRWDMLINLSVNEITKTVNVNEGCFVANSVIVKLVIVKNDAGEITSFNYAVD
jgi:hypothetical protein